MSRPMTSELEARPGAWCVEWHSNAGVFGGGDALFYRAEADADIKATHLQSLEWVERVTKTALYSAAAIASERSRADRAVAERDEARGWAGGWQRVAETICTILDLGLLDADQIAGAVRSKFEASEATVTTLRARVAELENLFQAARGLCFGEDWNKGNHAVLHGFRQKLIDAVVALDPNHPAARTLKGEADDR